MRLFSKPRLSAPEIFVIVTLLISGLVACFMLPIGGGFDEETHLARIWEMSSFVFLPNSGLGKDMPFPTIFREMSYRRDLLVRAEEPDFLSDYANLPIDGLKEPQKLKGRRLTLTMTAGDIRLEQDVVVD